MAKFLLVGGLGHTDLSGKVPRPGLLMLRKALRQAGHDAEVANYATSLMPRMFPPPIVEQLAGIYRRTVKPLAVEGKSPLLRPWALWDMRTLKRTSQELAAIERRVYEAVGEELARRVSDGGFDAVGFSVYMGGSTTASILMADILRREFRDLPIFFGGPQTTHFAQTIYEETQSPTALVVGEGELSIVKLAETLDRLKAGHLSNLAAIPNLVYRTESGSIIATARRRLSLDEWARISAVPYEEGDFEGLMRYAFIETSRGCFYRCRFCPEPLLSGQQRYLKPAENIVNEMLILNRDFGLTHFEFVGSTTPPHQAEAIADELTARGLQDKFKWALFMRGKDERTKQTPYPTLMQKMKTAGASAIFFGVEAADNETLAEMDKDESIEDIRAAMVAAKEAGIAVVSSFIYPYPGMPANEADLIVDLLREVRPLSAPTQVLGLFPGTHCFENAREIGCEPLNPFTGRPQSSMEDPAILRYLLNYRFILSLPPHLWPPLPYRIDGRSFSEYTKETARLRRRISQLGILSGFSHTHSLIAQVLGIPPQRLAERMFYCSLTGDPQETQALIELFNRS